MTAASEVPVSDGERPLMDEVRRALCDRCGTRSERICRRLSDRSALWHGLCAAAMALAATSVLVPSAIAAAFTAFLVGLNGLLQATVLAHPHPLLRVFRSCVTSPCRIAAALCRRFRRFRRRRVARSSSYHNAAAVTSTTGGPPPPPPPPADAPADVLHPRRRSSHSSPPPPVQRPSDVDAPGHSSRTSPPHSDARRRADRNRGHDHERYSCYTDDDDDDDDDSAGPASHTVDSEHLTTAVRRGVRALLRRVDHVAAHWARSHEHCSDHDRARRRTAAAPGRACRTTRSRHR